MSDYYGDVLLVVLIGLSALSVCGLARIAWDRLRDEAVHRYRRWRWERDNPDEWRV